MSKKKNCGSKGGSRAAKNVRRSARQAKCSGGAQSSARMGCGSTPHWAPDAMRELLLGGSRDELFAAGVLVCLAGDLLLSSAGSMSLSDDFGVWAGLAGDLSKLGDGGTAREMDRFAADEGVVMITSATGDCVCRSALVLTDNGLVDPVVVLRDLLAPVSSLGAINLEDLRVVIESLGLLPSI